MAQSIGTVSQAAGSITVLSSEGNARQVNVGDQIFEGDVVSTGGKGSSIDITFNNGCKMALGAMESALVDESVYKLEFFDDADIVVDLESAEGISDAVALTEDEIVEESAEDLDPVYLADSDETIDLDAMEDTASGGGDDSQVDVGVIEERSTMDSTTPLPSHEGDDTPFTAPQGGGNSDTDDHTTINYGTPDSPTLTLLNLDSNGFVNDVPVISGSAPEGSEIEIFDYDNTIITLVVDESETFSFEPEDLEDGEHSLTAQVTSPGGVTGALSDPIIFTLDTVAPLIPTVEGVDLTSSTTPTLSGNAEINSTIEVNVAGQTYTTTTDEAGDWSITLAETAEGVHDVTLTITDQAGNSSESSLGSITIDTTAPDNPTIDPLDVTNNTTPTFTGTAEANSTIAIAVAGETYSVDVNDQGTWSLTTNVLSDGDYAITVTATDEAGNSSESSLGSITIDTTAPDNPTIDPLDVTNNTTPTFTGTAEANSTIAIAVAGETYSVDVNDQGTWSLTTNVLSDGDYAITVTATDEAGNSSESSLGSITIDTTAPDGLNIASIDILSSDSATITGSVEANSTITLSVANEDHTITANNDGIWSLTLNELESGSHTISVTATDTAGNSSESILANILIDTSSVSFSIDDDASTQGTTHTIEDTTLLGITADDHFDSTSQTLNIDIAQADNVTTHNNGFGVTGGDQGSGNRRAINTDEALIIELDAPIHSVDVAINQLSFFESGQWITYDENMQRLDDGSFGSLHSLFSSDENFDSSFWANQGTLSIESDETPFQYIVFTTADSWQGSVSNFFVEDISYEIADNFTYTMTLENIPMDDTDTMLFIDGLSQDLVLQDEEGNNIGTYENNQWALNEEDIQELSSINGTLDIQIVSQEPLDSDSITPTFTLIETQSQDQDFTSSDSISPLTDTAMLFDFDNFDDIQRIDLSEDEINMNGLTVKDVMHLSQGEQQLEIISGEHDAHVLTLNASDWELRTDTQGNELAFENDGNVYNIYSSTDVDNQYDLIIDEMVTIVLAS